MPHHEEAAQSDAMVKPPIDDKEVPDLVKRIFGLEVVSVKTLDAFEDTNYLIKVNENSSNPYIKSTCSDGYVLKIMNSIISQNTELLQGQNDMMEFLKLREFVVPFPMKNLDGRTLKKEKMAKDGQEIEYVIRLLTFLDWKILGNLPFTTKLCYETGILIGNLQKALKNFHNEAVKTRKYNFRIESLPEIHKYMTVIKDSEKIEVFQEIINGYNTKIVPVLDFLEKGIVHGDMNDNNILVEENGTEMRVKGVIDFGDVSCSRYIFDLAIAMAHIMMETPEGGSNSIKMAGYVLKGYITVRNLTETEWKILKIAIAARFTQTYIFGNYFYLSDPNNKYLLDIATKGWDVLKHLWREPEESLIKAWNEIIRK